jgi:hypothetical protein
LDRAVNLFRGTGLVWRKPGSEAVRKSTYEIVANAQDIMENAPKTSTSTVILKLSWCPFNAFNIKNTFNLKFYRLYIAATSVKLRGFLFSVTKHVQFVQIG